MYLLMIFRYFENFILHPDPKQTLLVMLMSDIWILISYQITFYLYKKKYKCTSQSKNVSLFTIDIDQTKTTQIMSAEIFDTLKSRVLAML